nr:NADH dehydrogenase subunit 4L [Strongylocotes lipogonus]
MSMIFMWMLLLGIAKLSSSKSMVVCLMSIELLVVSVFYLATISGWWVMSLFPVVTFLTLVVLEGVVGLLILTSLFLSFEVNSSLSLYF